MNLHCFLSLKNNSVRFNPISNSKLFMLKFLHLLTRNLKHQRVLRSEMLNTLLSNWLHKQNLSWETDSHSIRQEIRCLLWNPKVRYRVHKSPLLRTNLMKCSLGEHQKQSGRDDNEFLSLPGINPWSSTPRSFSLLEELACYPPPPNTHTHTHKQTSATDLIWKVFDRLFDYFTTLTQL
jgi:hypothetical protein